MLLRIGFSATLSHAASAVQQLARPDHLHENGLVHQDIKPSNMISKT
jgi:serine/threonine protein kinase